MAGQLAAARCPRPGRARRITSRSPKVSRHPNIRIPLLLLAILVLQACASRRGLELPDLTEWSSRQAVLGSIEHWEFKGRIGVSSGSEGFNGKLLWTQENADFRATVSGPLGVGTVRIAGNGAAMTLTDKDGELTDMQDAEYELRQRYGWTIPVASLRYWALGIPDPALAADLEFDQQGLPSRIEQRGWVVTITDYRDGGGQPMPRRLSAVHLDAKLRLVIDNWVFH